MFVRSFPILALLAVAVVLAGCGSQTAGPAGPLGTPGQVAPSVGASTAPPPLQDPTVRTTEPSSTITPQPDAQQLVPQRWTRAEAVPGESAVLVHGTLTGGPPCAVLGRVAVTETATAVEITTFVGRQPGADCSGAQVQVAQLYVTKVALKAPLGSRTVRDGA